MNADAGPTPSRARELGLNDERTQTRGTTNTNGNRGNPQPESQPQAGKTWPRGASPSRPATSRHVRRRGEPRRTGSVCRPAQSYRRQWEQGQALMPMDESVRKAVLGAVPSLRAFAISLCGNVDRADDLVQETMLRALANIDSFQPGTNMSAWLFTILRNHFRSEYRKRRREVEDSDGHYADSLKTQPEQYGQVEFREFKEALGHLPADQREALILVGASGFSYEEAANICGCAVGTIKSRVNRARTRLAELLSIDGVNDFGPDDQTRAVLARGGE